jgi:hypothetical protein
VIALAQQTEDHASRGLQRFCIRFTTLASTNVDDARFIDIFHAWIQRQALPGILIDVADYRHVPDGPGVMLVSHEANLYVAPDGNRYSLTYQRKTAQPGTLPQRISAAAEVALTACQLLECEQLLHGALKFDPQQWAFVANDRLLAPNDEATFYELRDDLALAAAGVYGSDNFHTEYVHQDARERLTVNVRAARPVDVRMLLEKLRGQRHG